MTGLLPILLVIVALVVVAVWLRGLRRELDVENVLKDRSLAVAERRRAWSAASAKVRDDQPWLDPDLSDEDHRALVRLYEVGSRRGMLPGTNDHQAMSLVRWALHQRDTRGVPLTTTLKRELADDRYTEARESMSPDLPGFATDRIAAIKMAARESTERDADERQGA